MGQGHGPRSAPHPDRRRWRPQEFELLHLLVEHSGQLCTPAEVCAALFPGSTSPLPTLLAQVHPLVFQLRHAIEHDPPQPEILLTNYGKRYLLSVPANSGEAA